MKQYMWVALLVVLGFVTGGWAMNEILALSMTDMTQEDLPLKASIGSTTWDGTALMVEGFVENNGEKTYDTIRVKIVLKNMEGNIQAGSNTINVNPDRVAPGESGRFNGRVDCLGTQPGIMHYEVTGVALQ